jgi:hypothetical protein
MSDHQALVEALLMKSILGQDLVDTKFHLFSGRSPLSSKTSQLQALSANDVVLTARSEFFAERELSFAYEGGELAYDQSRQYCPERGRTTLRLLISTMAQCSRMAWHLTIMDTLLTAILKMMKMMMKLVKRRSAIKLPPPPIVRGYKMISDARSDVSCKEKPVNQMKMTMIHLSWRVVGVKLIQQSVIPFQPVQHKQ